MNAQPNRDHAQPLPVWGFGDKLRKARDLASMGQKEFATAVGLNPSSLAAYEKGRTSPRFSDAPRLARRIQMLTGIPADWFLVEDDPNRPVGPDGIEPSAPTVKSQRFGQHHTAEILYLRGNVETISA